MRAYVYTVKAMKKAKSYRLSDGTIKALAVLVENKYAKDATGVIERAIANAEGSPNPEWVKAPYEVSGLINGVQFYKVDGVDVKPSGAYVITPSVLTPAKDYTKNFFTKSK